MATNIRPALRRIVVIASAVALVWWVTRVLRPPIDGRDLLEILREAREALEYPGLTVQVAAERLRSPDEALRFVTSGVAYAPYDGSFTGPDGVLRTRVGNSIDRALLLKALLERLGYETRVLTSEWPSAAVPIGLSRDTDWIRALNRLARRAGYESGGREEFVAMMRAFREAAANQKLEVERSLERLERLIGSPLTSVDQPEAAAPPVRELRWIWVEGRPAGRQQWRTFDPTFPHLSRPSERRVIAAPAAAQFSITLVGVHMDGSASRLLTWTGDAGGYDAAIHLAPAGSQAARRLRSSGPEDIHVWMPFLKVGPELVRGSPFTLDGMVIRSATGRLPVELDGTGQLRVEAVPIDSLAISSIDTTSYPRVRIGVDVQPRSRPYWHARHFRVTDEGRRMRIRIDSAYQEPRPVVLVIDVSASMKDEGRIEVAKQALHTLVDRLAGDQRVAILSFSDKVRTIRALEPVGTDRTNVHRLIDELTADAGTHLVDAVDAAIRLADVPAYVLLLTDGQDNRRRSSRFRSMVNDLLAAVKASKSVVLPVGVGPADHSLLRELAAASGTEYHHVPDLKSLPAVYGWLGDSIRGRVVISYEAPPGHPGERRVTDLTVTGFDHSVSASYVVPPTGVDPRQLSAIEAWVGVAGLNRPLNVQRTIIDLSHERPAWNLVSVHHLAIAAGPYPMRVVASRAIDHWIELLQSSRESYRVAQDRGAFDRAMSSMSVRIVNGMAAVMQGLTEGPFQWRSPAVFLFKAGLSPAEDNLVARRSLDVLAFPERGGIDGPAALTRDAARWGLAMAAAEAHLLGTTSVNQQILDRAEHLIVATTPADLPAESPGELYRLVGGGSIALLPRDTPQFSWLITPAEGTLRAYASEKRVTAKGAAAERLAAPFIEYRTWLKATGLLGTFALNRLSMQTALIEVIAAVAEATNKLWCYATVNIGLIGEPAEHEDAFDGESAQAEAARLCEIGDAERLTEELIESLLPKPGELLEGIWLNTAEDALGVLGAPDWVGTAVSEGVPAVQTLVEMLPPVTPNWSARVQEAVTAGSVEVRR